MKAVLSITYELSVEIEIHEGQSAEEAMLIGSEGLAAPFLARMRGDGPTTDLFAKADLDWVQTALTDEDGEELLNVG